MANQDKYSQAPKIKNVGEKMRGLKEKPLGKAIRPHELEMAIFNGCGKSLNAVKIMLFLTGNAEGFAVAEDTVKKRLCCDKSSYLKVRKNLCEMGWLTVRDNYIYVNYDKIYEYYPGEGSLISYPGESSQNSNLKMSSSNNYSIEKSSSNSNPVLSSQNNYPNESSSNDHSEMGSQNSNSEKKSGSINHPEMSSQNDIPNEGSQNSNSEIKLEKAKEEFDKQWNVNTNMDFIKSLGW